MIKYVSFDLDGTLADDKFDSLIWEEELPRLFAEKHNTSINKAKTLVYADYYKSLYIEKIDSWTNLPYWFKRLELDNWQKLLDDTKKHIRIYLDTLTILKYLSKKYKLVVITSAEDHFINLKLEKIRYYFEQVFSAPKLSSSSKKSKELYLKILRKLRLKPGEMVHVGDDKHLDYEIPRSLGIKAFHLVRSKSIRDNNIIHSLNDLKETL